MKIRDYLIREKKPTTGLLPFEWVAFAYLAFTVVMMVILWDKIANPSDMIKGRIQFTLVTLAMWGVYRLWPCRLTIFSRILVQMAFLGWWYPDTYEMNRALPISTTSLQVGSNRFLVVSPPYSFHKRCHTVGSQS